MSFTVRNIHSSAIILPDIQQQAIRCICTEIHTRRKAFYHNPADST